MLPTHTTADRISAFNKTAVAGATADTAIKATPGVFRGVAINTAGAASSTVEIFDGSVGGTAFAAWDGTVTGVWIPFDVECTTSIRIKTVDSGGNMRLTVFWR